MARFNSYMLLAALPLASLAIAAGLTSCKNHDHPTKAPDVKVTVQVMGATSTDNAAPRSFSGTVESAEASTVSFSVPGTITELTVDVGSHVGRGQLLARVRSESLINARNIAQAALAQAQDAYTRMKKLHDADALPDMQWVEVQQTLKQAQNAADIAERAVGDAAIYAPFTGYVTEKLADRGQTVIASQPVLTLASIGDMRVAISVPESEIGSFAEGSEAAISLDALPDLKLKGKLTQRSIMADPLTRAYTVKYAIPSQPQAKVLPGMIATVVPTLSATNDSTAAEASTEFVLPPQAVLLGWDNRQFVWTVKNGRAHQQFVTASELAPGGAVVSSGLHRGDSVIVAGMPKVSESTRVIPTL